MLRFEIRGCWIIMIDVSLLLCEMRSTVAPAHGICLGVSVKTGNVVVDKM